MCKDGIMKSVTTRIPERDEKALKEMQEEFSIDRSEALRRLIENGLQEWKKEKALRKLKDHKITIRRAAEIAETTYVEMLEMANEEGIEIGYKVEDLERDLERLE